MTIVLMLVVLIC